MGRAAQKARGAYYTDPTIAAFLVRWAIRSPSDRVLDPCFGEGIFLLAATERFTALGGNPVLSITGIEIDPQAHHTTAQVLSNDGTLHRNELICEDFFALDPSKVGLFTAVVGNPPFIRYQRFAGAQRARALAQASRAGVQLTALTSAWAPFIVHATTFLKPGGRLAMVVPAELCHAAYARPVLLVLGQKFAHVRVLTFRRRLFPDLSEDTVLVLGEGYGQEGKAIRLVSLPDVSALLQDDVRDLDGTPVAAEAVEREAIRLIAYLLPDRVRQLYHRLIHHPHVIRLGTIATAGIGYVTGNNDYFHLSAAEACELGIPPNVLARGVCRAAWLNGLVLTKKDWRALDREGHKTRLLNLAGLRGNLPRAVEAYRRAGERRNVHTAYKCRVREPWYIVPHVVAPDLFLTYMANTRPTLVVNRARAVAPNTLLCVRLDPLAKVRPEALAASWWTSLTALSAEVEGHSLGGGMLKLEPGEAVKVLLPFPPLLCQALPAQGLVAELDGLIRRKANDEALDLGDREILQAGLGLSRDDCAVLRQGFNSLLDRRRRR